MRIDSARVIESLGRELLNTGQEARADAVASPPPYPTATGSGLRGRGLSLERKTRPQVAKKRWVLVYVPLPNIYTKVYLFVRIIPIF